MTAPDLRRERAADVGTWLFLASLVMFYASLYSGYVLLRAGSETWQAPWLRDVREAQLVPFSATQTLWLLSAWATVWRSGATAAALPLTAMVRWWPVVAAVIFTAGWLRAAGAMTSAGRGPATSVAAASWFVLTGVVVVGVVGGAAATTWMGGRRPAPHVTRQLRRYWTLMLACWCSIVIGMYLL